MIVSALAEQRGGEVHDLDSHDGNGIGPELDAAEQAAWISEETSLSRDVVDQVLELEFEYLVGVGIAQVPDHQFRYYSPDELESSGDVVDVERLARDAERLLGIPPETALQVFEAEHRFLQSKGLAD